jgi:lysophospholipase L1-like esterase
VVSGLPAGSHHLLLVKRTEGFSGANFGDPTGNAPSTFGGLVLDDGASLTALGTAPARKILFIGDSISVGYGVDSSSLTCPAPDYDHPYTNNYRAFTSLTGRRFEADYQVSAVSGHGLVRNYGDN